MFRVELVADQSHCIETVANKEYQETVKKLLAAEEVSDKLKDRAEILRLFLQTADFRKLRAQSEARLLQGEKVRFLVYLEDGIVKCDMSAGAYYNE